MRPSYVVERLRRLRSADAAGRRLLMGIFANLAGKIWVLAVQLLAIPVLTQRWGADGYGTWLMVSTIPTYVALSNVGLGAAAGVDITAKTANGRYGEALTTFQSVWCLVSSVLIMVTAIAGGVAWIYATFNPHKTELAMTVFLMVLYAVGIVQMSLLTVVFRSTKKYALGTALNDLMVPLEGCALILTAFNGGHILGAAICITFLRWMGWVGYYQILKRSESWVRLGWSNAEKATVKRLALPSLAALSLTLSDSLGLQGVVLTMGWSAGPAVVAVYSATRFLSRIPLQFAGLFTRAAIPELSRAVASRDVVLVNRLLAINVGAAVAAFSPFLVALLVAGPYLLGHLSHHNLVAPQSLFIFMGLSAAANALWNAMSAPLLASNRQTEYAPIYLILCALIVTMPLFKWESLIFTAAGSMLSEMIMVGLVMTRSSFHRKAGWKPK